MNLFLDDLRSAPNGFTIARNADECILLLEDSPIYILCLDYHLGHGEKTGMCVVDYLIEKQRWPKEIYLHSSDLEMRRLMYSRLTSHIPPNVKVQMTPFRTNRMG